jgi:RNA binding exosome subunit
MKPILLVHGYSSEGEDNSVSQIYGTLPADLRSEFGADTIHTLNLSRWLSLNDGVRLDDVSYAMDRALRSPEYSDLLLNGFHVVIHSTGALVVRNWIKMFSPKPSPIENFVHLAGANFGSGLAHIGKAQIVRWARYLGTGTQGGRHILDELEFGNWKTLDLHLHFLKPGNSMREDYQVQEFCIAGSQTTKVLRAAPIRYVKEDSSDNTVRTSAANLNYTSVHIAPTEEARQLSVDELQRLVQERKEDQSVRDSNYSVAVNRNHPEVPFSVAYETGHFGEKIGIVSGSRNRKEVMPKLKRALQTPLEDGAYTDTREYFREQHQRTFERVGRLKTSPLGWSKQAQYEGHAQIIFRLRDQYGEGVRQFDITFRTSDRSAKKVPLESLIEDDHKNKEDDGTLTFYLRTQAFSKSAWLDKMSIIAPTRLEIFATETDGQEIEYLPVNLQLSSDFLRDIVKSFQTTIIDVEMLRLPTRKVFEISKG